ncbi:helix-turn-helix domain-containing protein [Agrobacterium larrymoorei]|uniref:Helix-turn-helix transcriptional regulator n=1 Tax=Agrobacterium larrymoorei TaxID=160699 RepID=A0AAF0H995_9HYPH|nr:helix-turn-helix transcriptional regulator [Agrobacterium larrymoorei]WHA41918.1 helix-turn-helix transcriptional regulator [Agrobacterium larrymoorei]
MDIQEIFAHNLRKIRVAKHISQDELALRSGVERAYVGHVERATKNPTIKTVEKLALALECEIGELFRAVSDHEREINTLPRGRKNK